MLLLGLAAAAVVTWRSAEIIRASDEDRFRNNVANAQDAIADRLDTYMALLRSGASYIASQRDVTREEFHDYVARLDVSAAYPGIQGIGWSRRMAPEELADLVAATRADGIEDFRVWPDDEREEYHAIVFLEPLDRRNQAAIGYDMFTNPTRRAAMEEARDTGLPRATGKVTLVQEIDERKQAGFLIYMPVYEGDGVPSTVAERRKKLRGFVYSPFRADDLLAGVFAKEGRPHVDFTVYDRAAAPESQLHHSGSPGAGRFRTSETLVVAGRPWTISYQTRPEFEFASWRGFVPVAFAVGAVLSVLFAAFTYLEGKAREAAERAAAALAASQKEREHLLESEREARLAAERTGRMKDEFLATLSHELRTPLNAILGFSTLLGMADLDEKETEEAREAIERNARVQAKLIEDLLDMNRIVSGKLRLDLRQVDPAAALRAALDDAAPAAEEKGVTLVRQFQHGGEPIVADPVRLQQIVWNLLSNAVKFTPAGGEVRLSLQQYDEHVMITVADNGAGISAEFLPHVFDRFRQADGTTTRKHGGLGLGLSIVRNLVELHGGSVTAESGGVGRGAIFRVELPATSGAAPSLPTVESDVTESRTGRSDGDLSGVRVLVVDDEPDATALIKRLLQQRNAEVTPAMSAEEAWALLSQKPYDVLLSDIGMPREDGYQFIRRIRSSDRPFRAIPAAALTAFARAEDRARAAEAGFDEHLAKPVEAALLIRTVKRLHEGAPASRRHPERSEGSRVARNPSLRSD